MAVGRSCSATSLRYGRPILNGLAAYRIPRVRIVVEPEYVRSLPVDVFSKWILLILPYQTARTDKDLGKPDCALRDLAWAGPPAVVRWATTLILRHVELHDPERALKWLIEDRQSPELRRSESVARTAFASRASSWTRHCQDYRRRRPRRPPRTGPRKRRKPLALPSRSATDSHGSVGIPTVANILLSGSTSPPCPSQKP